MLMNTLTQYLSPKKTGGCMSKWSTIPIRKWCKDVRSRTFRSGFVGKGYKLDDAIKIEQTLNYNGGGENSFGGSKKWPVLMVTIPFVEGTPQKEIDHLKNRLQEVIDNHLPDK